MGKKCCFCFWFCQMGRCLKQQCSSEVIVMEMKKMEMSMAWPVGNEEGKCLAVATCKSCTFIYSSIYSCMGILFSFHVKWEKYLLSLCSNIVFTLCSFECMGRILCVYIYIGWNWMPFLVSGSQVLVSVAFVLPFCLVT